MTRNKFMALEDDKIRDFIASIFPVVNKNEIEIERDEEGKRFICKYASEWYTDCSIKRSKETLILRNPLVYGIDSIKSDLFVSACKSDLSAFKTFYLKELREMGANTYHELVGKIFAIPSPNKRVTQYKAGGFNGH